MLDKTDSTDDAVAVGRTLELRRARALQLKNRGTNFTPCRLPGPCEYPKSSLNTLEDAVDAVKEVLSVLVKCHINGADGPCKKTFHS